MLLAVYVLFISHFQDSRYFISGCSDGRIRLWHAHEKKVMMWNEVENVKFITAMTFVPNGKYVVVSAKNYFRTCLHLIP